MIMSNQTLYYSNLREFVEWRSEKSFYKWILQRYDISRAEWRFYKNNGYLDGFYDFEVIKDWYMEQPEKYIIKTIGYNQEETYLMVIQIGDDLCI